MRWWKKASHHPTAANSERGLLDELATAGVEVVLFVPRCKSGAPCAEAMMLDGGRIPIKLAERTPLAACTDPKRCECEYTQLDPPSPDAAEMCGPGN